MVELLSANVWRNHSEWDIQERMRKKRHPNEPVTTAGIVKIFTDRAQSTCRRKKNQGGVNAVTNIGGQISDNGGDQHRKANEISLKFPTLSRIAGVLIKADEQQPRAH